MRALRNLLLCTAAMAFAGCDENDGLVGTAPNVPLAFTRFVNAVADHDDQDWRFIDQLEYSPPAFGLGFREFTPYQGTAPGNRPLRIFPTSDDIGTTSQRLVDTTLTFQAGTYYTIVHTGLTGDGSNGVVVIQDDIPATIADDKFAIRAINMGTGVGNIDVYATATASSPITGAPQFANVAVGSATTYATFDTGAVALQALAAGSVTPALAASAAPAGVAADPEENLTAIGGTRRGGSAIVGIFTPRSVAGSDAPQGTSFQSPAWVYIIDRHPR